VQRKTFDIVTQQPDYGGKPTKGGKLDREILQAFLERPPEMHAQAEAIRAGIQSGELTDLPATPDADMEEAAREGRVLLLLHLKRERNPKLRAKKINDVMPKRGCLECEVCGFDFERTYGERGTRYAEVHHVTSLHVSGLSPNDPPRKRLAEADRPPRPGPRSSCRAGRQSHHRRWQGRGMTRRPLLTPHQVDALGPIKPAAEQRWQLVLSAASVAVHAGQSNNSPNLAAGITAHGRRPHARRSIASTAYMCNDTNMTERGPVQALMSAVGELVRGRRKERGWTQTQLGERIGVDQSSVSEWERGVSLPSDLKRVAAALEIPIEELHTVMEAAVLRQDDVEKAIRLQTLLSAETREALVRIYRKVLAAELQP
jgi:transcriptional regulator with XRE-family HTH domain